MLTGCCCLETPHSLRLLAYYKALDFCFLTVRADADKVATRHHVVYIDASRDVSRLALGYALTECSENLVLHHTFLAIAPADEEFSGCRIREDSNALGTFHLRRDDVAVRRCTVEVTLRKLVEVFRSQANVGIIKAVF